MKSPEEGIFYLTTNVKSIKKTVIMVPYKKGVRMSLIEVACIEKLYGAFPREEAELRTVFDECMGVKLELSKILPDIVMRSINTFGGINFDNIVIIGADEINMRLSLSFVEKLRENIRQIMTSKSFHRKVSINEMLSAFFIEFSEKIISDKRVLACISELVESALQLCYLAIISKQSYVALKMKRLIRDMILKGNYPLGYKSDNLVILAGE